MYALVDVDLTVQYNDKLGQISLHRTVTDATPSILDGCSRWEKRLPWQRGHSG